MATVSFGFPKKDDPTKNGYPKRHTHTRPNDQSGDCVIPRNQIWSVQGDMTRHSFAPNLKRRPDRGRFEESKNPSRCPGKEN